MEKVNIYNNAAYSIKNVRLLSANAFLFSIKNICFSIILWPFRLLKIQRKFYVASRLVNRAVTVV